jgi:hypothetical protein
MGIIPPDFLAAARWRALKKKHMKQNTYLFAIMIVGIWSCASLGSKTLYLDENIKLIERTKIIVSQPTLINVNQATNEVQEILTLVAQQELKEFNFVIEKSEDKLPEFNIIETEMKNAVAQDVNADYILSAKIELLKAMNQTRDCKVEYKLISTKTGKLVFHSKYNTTFGATVVIIPGIKDYPNTDQIMLIGLSSGFHQFKNRLMKK